MKPIHRFLIWSGVLTFCLSVWCLVIFAASESSQYLLLEFQQSDTSSTSSLLNWLDRNFLLIALIVSEIAAILPSRASGIIHAVLIVFSKYKSKS